MHAPDSGNTSRTTSARLDTALEIHIEFFVGNGLYFELLRIATKKTQGAPIKCT